VARNKLRTAVCRHNPWRLFGLSLAIWAFSGCGPAGVGSVDIPPAAIEKPVGAPPKPRPKPGVNPPVTRPTQARKTTPTFIPG
jgi:hypothetical protein